jgi:uncharacterized protein
MRPNSTANDNAFVKQMKTTLTLNAVRHLLLATQGLLYPPERPAAKEDVLNAIRRMGALQIDTIHVVARSPYLVLFSRLGDYDPRWLEELLAEGRLFEYWSHAASFLPIEDYPLYASRMEKFNSYWYTPEWRSQNQSIVDLVLQRINDNGEVRSADFERTDGKKGTWWDWKVEKRVLEYLHTRGTLMIARREKFQRVYNLRERILPDWDDAQAIPLEAAEDELTVRAVRVLGAAPARWVPDYYRLPKVGMPKRLERLVEAGRLKQVSVEGREEPWYLHPENLSLLEYAMTGEMVPTYTTLLSPFDPLVWDRERARVLFDFDFSIECYLPQEKRRYGYFLLPILHEGQLIGRLDAKAHRKEGIFEVRALYLEPGVKIFEDTVTAVAAAIQRCATWHGTPQVAIRKTEPPELDGMLAAALQGQTALLPEDEDFVEDDQFKDIQDVF